MKNDYPPIPLTVREKYQLRCEHCDKINDIVLFPEHTCMECGFHFPIHKGDCFISYMSLNYFCKMMSDGSTDEEREGRKGSMKHDYPDDEWHLEDPNWFPRPLDRTTEELERDMNDPTISIMDRRYVPKPGSGPELKEMTEVVMKKTKRITWVIRICVGIVIILILKAIFEG